MKSLFPPTTVHFALRRCKVLTVRQGTLLVLLSLIASLYALGQTNASHVKAIEYPTATIREEQTITIGGVSETWRLEWQALPKPYCEPNEESLTCPCEGFAFGEIGDLFLVRLRNGTVIDRVHLTPLFGETKGAVLQRWPVDDDYDSPNFEREDFADAVRKRPLVQVMQFDDYDHDGEKTEFYLQTEAICCGHRDGVVIGVSKSDPRLHVFGTVSNPGKPLYLAKHEWDALRNSKSHKLEIVDWACGDHAADTQTEFTLEWSVDGVSGVRREYTCPAEGQSRNLVSQQPL